MNETISTKDLLNLNFRKSRNTQNYKKQRNGT